MLQERLTILINSKLHPLVRENKLRRLVIERKIAIFFSGCHPFSDLGNKDFLFEM